MGLSKTVRWTNILYTLGASWVNIKRSFKLIANRTLLNSGMKTIKMKLQNLNWKNQNLESILFLAFN